MLVILPPLIKYTGNSDSISEDALSKVKMSFVRNGHSGGSCPSSYRSVCAVNNIQSNKSFLIFGNIYRFFFLFY